MLDASAKAFFDRAYGTDLVFEADCWKLCGDAHCCSFSRHKARFELMSDAAQELPLLPGEWAYLREQGWDAQFGVHEVRRHQYEIDGYTIRWLTMASRRPGCACDHDTRTVVCRLYPLLPRLDAGGQLVGTETVGMYEELEVLEGLDPACKVDHAPFDQLGLFIDLANGIGADPVRRFYLLAYQHAKRHVFDRLAARRDASVSAFRQFELALFRRRLFDHEALRSELSELLREVSAGDVAAFVARADELHAADERHLAS